LKKKTHLEHKLLFCFVEIFTVYFRELQHFAEVIFADKGYGIIERK